MFLQSTFPDKHADCFDELVIRRIVIGQLHIDKCALSDRFKNFLQGGNFLSMEFLREKAAIVRDSIRPQIDLNWAPRNKSEEAILKPLDGRLR